MKLLFPLIRSELNKALKYQGTGRHKPDEVDSIVNLSFKALSAYLGNYAKTYVQEYLFMLCFKNTPNLIQLIVFLAKNLYN